MTTARPTQPEPRPAAPSGVHLESPTPPLLGVVVLALSILLPGALATASDPGTGSSARHASPTEGAQEGEDPPDRTLRQRVARLETALEQLRAELDNALEPVRVQLANRGERLRQLQSRIAALEERLTLADERMAELNRLLSEARSPSSDEEISSPMPAPRGPAGATGPKAAASRESGSPPSSEADSLYRAAYLDYLRSNYELAISGFREFLNRFPDSARADNALYWIGDSRYASGDLPGALETFREVIERFPEGDAVPDAMFKAGLTRIDLGDGNGAARELRQLIESHPASEPAQHACRQLRRLDFALPPECPSTEGPGG